MKQIIVGRSGTGKTELASRLAALGMDVLSTCATRPRRGNDDSFHTFLSPQEAAAIPPEDKLCRVNFDGYEYFARRQDAESAEIMVLEPSGAHEIAATFSDEAIMLVHVTADPMLAAKHAADRIPGDPAAASHAFMARAQAEDPIFKPFEESLADLKNGKESDEFAVIVQVTNDFQPETLDRWAEYLASYARVHANVRTIVEQSAAFGHLEVDEDNRIKVVNMDLSEHWMSADKMAETILYDKEGFHQLFRAWLSHDLAIGVPPELIALEIEDSPGLATESDIRMDDCCVSPPGEPAPDPDVCCTDCGDPYAPAPDACEGLTDPCAPAAP